MTIKEFRIQYALGSLSDDMKRKITQDPRTLKGVLKILSTDKDYSIRWNIANNPNTPAKILTKLSTDKKFECKIGGK